MEQMRIHDIITHMIHTDRTHRASCDRALSSLGLHQSQLRMLMHLWHHDGILSQRQLAEELHVSAAVVTVTVKKLEAEGYITRTVSTVDRRNVMILLTPLGRETVNRAHGTLDGVDAEMLKGFSEEEKKQLAEFYKRMLFNLNKGEESDI